MEGNLKNIISCLLLKKTKLNLLYQVDNITQGQTSRLFYDKISKSVSQPESKY